jgi:N-acetylmuramoyl-L-alanine amidase
MKRIWIVCLWIGFTLLCNPTLAQVINKPIVVLDPGHGGVDSGAIGINGIKEKDVVLEVAMEVIRLNDILFDNTLDIYLTRYKDTLISLGHRTKLARALQPDYFISIHCNQATRNAAQGIEVYVQQPKPNRNLELQSRSETLAKTILREFDNSLGFRIRGRKYANFQVLRETQLTCPAVLLELGFLSNWEEAEHSKRKESVAGFALGVLQSLNLEID